MRVSSLNVNLRANLARRCPRFEILGVDQDGRTYYALTPRVVEDEGRPPLGWASGLLVYGRGIRDEEDLPTSTDRWCHFGKSGAVKQLAKWVEWRAKEVAVAARPKPTPKKSVSTPIQVKPTPKSTVKSASKATLTPKKSLFDIIIPASTKKSTSESSLSDLCSSSSSDNLLELVAPKGYRPSPAVVEEGGKELCRRLLEAEEWLEVLEWKGMGEVF